MKKNILSFIGFLLFIFGFTALVLSLVGVKWAFLVWMDEISPLFGFIMKLMFVVVGIITVYLAKFNWEAEE